MMEGGSPKMIRKPLQVNNQRARLNDEFQFNPVVGYKSVAEPSIATWGNSGKGVSGETVNATNQGSKTVVNKRWRPISS